MANLFVFAALWTVCYLCWNDERTMIIVAQKFCFVKGAFWDDMYGPKNSASDHWIDQRSIAPVEPFLFFDNVLIQRVYFGDLPRGFHG